MEGDFTLEVTVEGVTPEEATPKHAQLRKAFYSQGIVLFLDVKHFIRLEKAKTFPTAKQPINYVNWEVVEQGKFIKRGSFQDFALTKDAPLSLKLERRQGSFIASVKSGDQDWQKLKGMEAKFAEKCSVGLVASHTGNEGFTAKFSGLKLEQAEPKPEAAKTKE